jgi:hypothetical protein
MGGLKGSGGEPDQRERAETCCSKVLLMFAYYMVYGEQLPSSHRSQLAYWKKTFEDGRGELLKAVKFAGLIHSKVGHDTQMTWLFLALLNARTVLITEVTAELEEVGKMGEDYARLKDLLGDLTGPDSGDEKKDEKGEAGPDDTTDGGEKSGEKGEEEQADAAGQKGAAAKKDTAVGGNGKHAKGKAQDKEDKKGESAEGGDEQEGVLPKKKGKGEVEEEEQEPATGRGPPSRNFKTKGKGGEEEEEEEE